jgi:hypothetical protein
MARRASVEQLQVEVLREAAALQGLIASQSRGTPDQPETAFRDHAGVVTEGRKPPPPRRTLDFLRLTPAIASSVPPVSGAPVQVPVAAPAPPAAAPHVCLNFSMAAGACAREAAYEAAAKRAATNGRRTFFPAADNAIPVERGPAFDRPNNEGAAAPLPSPDSPACAPANGKAKSQAVWDLVFAPPKLDKDTDARAFDASAFGRALAAARQGAVQEEEDEEENGGHGTHRSFFAVRPPAPLPSSAAPAPPRTPPHTGALLAYVAAWRGRKAPPAPGTPVRPTAPARPTAPVRPTTTTTTSRTAPIEARSHSLLQSQTGHAYNDSDLALLEEIQGEARTEGKQGGKRGLTKRWEAVKEAQRPTRAAPGVPAPHAAVATATGTGTSTTSAGTRAARRAALEARLKVVLDAAASVMASSAAAKAAAAREQKEGGGERVR